MCHDPTSHKPDSHLVRAQVGNRRLHMYIQEHMYKYVCIYVYLYVRVCMHVCMYVCMQACMHAGMYKDKHSTKSFKTINQQYVRVCMHVCITQPNPSRQSTNQIWRTPRRQSTIVWHIECVLLLQNVFSEERHEDNQPNLQRLLCPGRHSSATKPSTPTVGLFFLL